MNIRNKQRETPLHLAVRHGSAETVAVLLGAGATVDTIDARGLTPVCGAVHRRRPDFVELLLHKYNSSLSHRAGLAPGTVYSSVSTLGARSPLHDAAALNDVRSMDLLLDAGADLNVLDPAACPLALVMQALPSDSGPESGIPRIGST